MPCAHGSCPSFKFPPTKTPMAKPSKIKIDVTKLLKQYFYKGQKGTYCTLVLWENKDGPDEYGNTHAVKQEIPKEARDAGEKEPYVGNGTLVTAEAPQERRQERPAATSGRGRSYQTPILPDDDGSEIPF